MTEDQAELLDKAERTLRVAKLTLAEGFDEFAVSHAYYAMFHAASAILLSRGLAFKTHSGAHTAFATEITRVGLLPAELHSWLVSAANDRLAANYLTGHDLGREDAVKHIERADAFLRHAYRFLGAP